MGQASRDPGNNKKRQGGGHIAKKVLEEDTQTAGGRPDQGGTAGQSGGEQAKNRSSNPKSVKP
ncbi:MAG: hypothetical protein JSR55_05330 [Proteobacteria bacterium]|nr:hypothetical protein [Pseudomonadota bacterium]